MSTPDPRWDEVTEQLVFDELPTSLTERWEVTWEILAALADNGLLLTPQMAEVLEAARVWWLEEERLRGIRAVPGTTFEQWYGRHVRRLAAAAGAREACQP